jgi:hypothetical protein
MLISTVLTAVFVGTEKIKTEGWKMKPEIIDYNKFMLVVDRADRSGMVPYYKWYREHVKWTKGFMLFLVQMANLNLPLGRKPLQHQHRHDFYNRI